MKTEKVGMNAEDKAELITDLTEAGRELSDADMDLLMKDSEARRLYRDLLECRTALALEENCSDVPDATAEWKRFSKRIHPAAEPIRKQEVERHSLYLFAGGVIAGIAASLLIVFMFSWTAPRNSGLPGSVVAQRTLEKKNASSGNVIKGTSSGSQLPSALPSSVSISSPAAPVSITGIPVTGTVPAATDAPVAEERTTSTETLPSENETADNVRQHTVDIPHGKDLKVVLSDGTIVWLNAASRITYPEYFVGKERVVTLEGEAYFQVRHDPAHPFVIHTRSISARVLGTELNVSCYAHSVPHVTLINGKVEVGSTAGRVTLQPGQEAQLTDNGNLSVENVDVKKYIYWKEGYLFFDNEPLSEVMQAICNWYNMKVVFEKKRLSALRVHLFCNRHRPVGETLVNLNKIYNLEATCKNNTIFIK